MTAKWFMVHIPYQDYSSIWYMALISAFMWFLRQGSIMRAYLNINKYTVHIYIYIIHIHIYIYVYDAL